MIGWGPGHTAHSVQTRDAQETLRGDSESREVDLWVAVLQRGISDALGHVEDNAKRGPRALAVRQARDWLGTQDFREVCIMAGLDPEYILAGVRQMQREGRQIRQYNGLGR